MMLSPFWIVWMIFHIGFKLNLGVDQYSVTTFLREMYHLFLRLLTAYNIISSNYTYEHQNNDIFNELCEEIKNNGKEGSAVSKKKSAWKAWGWWWLKMFKPTSNCYDSKCIFFRYLRKNMFSHLQTNFIWKWNFPIYKLIYVIESKKMT